MDGRSGKTFGAFGNPPKRRVARQGCADAYGQQPGEGVTDAAPGSRVGRCHNASSSEAGGPVKALMTIGGRCEWRSKATVRELGIRRVTGVLSVVPKN